MRERYSLRPPQRFCVADRRDPIKRVLTDTRRSQNMSFSLQVPAVKDGYLEALVL